MALVPVRITATFTEGGQPAEGVVYFRLAQRLVDLAADVILETVLQQAVLDTDGKIDFTVYTLTGVATGYWVTESIRDAPTRPAYLIPVLPTDTVLDLDVVTPIDDVEPAPSGLAQLQAQVQTLQARTRVVISTTPPADTSVVWIDSSA